MLDHSMSVKISDGERKQLKALAQKTQRSAHFLMREALVQFIRREEARLEFVDEAQAAWVDYQSTGRHISLEALEKAARSPKSLRLLWQK
jgi:predicted transcriptional regulator